MKDKQLSEKVIGAAFDVYNQLGFGFLESVYEKALSIELNKIEIAHQIKSPIEVYYHQQIVGQFICDLLVEQSLILEIKSVTQLLVAHEVQLVNYLTATKTNIGLLINLAQ